MKVLIVMLSLLQIASASNAGSFDKKVNAIIGSAKADCGDYVFAISKDAIQFLDLTSNGLADLAVIDEAEFSCSIGASFYCGSAGCKVHFVASHNVISGAAQAWEIIENQEGISVIRLSLHGSACEQVGYQICHRQLTISDGRVEFKTN